MKLAEIDNKYIEYIRNHDLVYKYGIQDVIDNIEMNDLAYYSIRKAFYGSELLVKEYPDEIDQELYVDNIIIDFECALNNHRKFEDDPTYDIEPWMDEYTKDHLTLLNENRIEVALLQENGEYETKYIDQRLIDGDLWKQSVT